MCVYVEFQNLGPLWNEIAKKKMNGPSISPTDEYFAKKKDTLRLHEN